MRRLQIFGPSSTFWRYLVASNYKWKMGQIFVALSEYPNFKRKTWLICRLLPNALRQALLTQCKYYKTWGYLKVTLILHWFPWPLSTFLIIILFVTSRHVYLVQLIEHPILQIPNFLFVYFLSIFPDKSFKLISKYTQKCQYNSLY